MGLGRRPGCRCSLLGVRYLAHERARALAAVDAGLEQRLPGVALNSLDLLFKPECGSKLNFLVQEMNREINTTASKANNTEAAQLSVDVKSEIEKLREQIQNIE